MKNLFKSRNGPDQLSQFVLSIAFFIAILNLFLRSNILSLIILVMMIYIFFRMFSKQTYKRRQENIRFAQKMYPYQMKLVKYAARQADKKTHKCFKCPNCKQTLRVPRGHGEITITCPKCHHQFDRKS